MTTFAQVRDYVLDDLHRRDLTTQVELALYNARDKLAMDRYWFNEGVTSFTATTTTDYDLATVLPTLLQVDTIRIWHNGTPSTLKRVSWDDLAELDETLGNGVPHSYAVHHQLLRIYPAPSASMSIEAAGLKNLSASAWCSYAPVLMRAMAQVEICALVTHDDAGMQRAAAYALGEKASLGRRLATLDSGGQVRPYL